MRHVHRPQRTVVYAAEDWYWCVGMLHGHKTERAALSCEQRPVAKVANKSTTRTRHEDGTFTVVDPYRSYKNATYDSNGEPCEREPRP